MTSVLPGTLPISGRDKVGTQVSQPPWIEKYRKLRTISNPQEPALNTCSEYGQVGLQGARFSQSTADKKEGS